MILVHPLTVPTPPKRTGKTLSLIIAIIISIPPLLMKAQRRGEIKYLVQDRHGPALKMARIRPQSSGTSAHFLNPSNIRSPTAEVLKYNERRECIMKLDFIEAHLRALIIIYFSNH